MAGSSVAVEKIVDHTIEQQDPTFLRIREQSQVAISDRHYPILQEQEERLRILGLRLSVNLNGERFLHASDRVGTFRLVSSNNRWVVVVVEPKIDSADVFRMIDRTSGELPEINGPVSEIASGETTTSVVFLNYFSRQVLQFVGQSNYRTYRFEERNSPSGARGRPLVAEYILKNLPRGRMQFMPSRYLELSSDVLENQVLAYSVGVARRLISVLELTSNPGLLHNLRACQEALAGVTPRRVTVRELATIRYSRSNIHFRAIHKLCSVLLQNKTIVMEPGEHIPFTAFSLHMPTLFQEYISALMTSALGQIFEGRQHHLTYSTGFGGRPIELDGLIDTGDFRIVVEAKYRSLDNADNEVALGSVPERHVYQTLAYATHQQVRASKGIIVYPTWDSNGPSVRISDEIRDFGWALSSTTNVGLRLLGVDLSASFHEVVAECAAVLSPILSKA